jgi:hypothetical protein
MRVLVVIYIIIFVFCTGCATYTTRLSNTPGRPTLYNDPGSVGPVAGLGVESQDIVSVTDRMVRDILACPTIAGRTTPPRVVIDATYFRNEGTQVINKNLITDLLRTELNRAANGKIIFLGRDYANMTEEERILEKEGVVTEGTQGPTKKVLGYDYRLVGRIATLDSVASKSGLTSRYHQITCELEERGTKVRIWSQTYQFKKSAQDDVIYR